MSFSKYIIKTVYADFFKDSFNPVIGNLSTTLQLDLKQLFMKNNKKFYLFFYKYKYDICNNVEEFLTAFCYLQKIHNAFNKLVRMYLFKKARQFNEHNLLLDDIPNNTPENKFYITLKENNTKYTFRIGELTIIIYNALTYHENYFIDSQKIKNPYTNLPFSICNLYNIYFFLLEKKIVPHELFQKLYYCNFILIRFIINNQVTIKDYIIINEANTMDDEETIAHIEDMLNDYLNIILCFGFDKTKLLHFQKYIYKYLYTLYGLNELKKRTIRKSLKAQLRVFKLSNKNFGRKIYKMRPVIGERFQIVDHITPYVSFIV